jgi:ABC-type Na+ efflux pump permease subunit
MKNEAVRVFFAVIALMLVAMLTSPAASEGPSKGTPIQRKLAALESLSSPVATAAKSLAASQTKKNKIAKKTVKKKKIASPSDKKNRKKV